MKALIGLSQQEYDRMNDGLIKSIIYAVERRQKILAKYYVNPELDYE